jgi:uncharacterized membrane protein YphA (DoxX/SURF4 family)
MKKFLNYHHIIRYGLGLIFIANALVAFFAPAEFIEIIQNSFIINFLPVGPGVFVKIVIGINDAIVGLLLISGFATRRVAIWATIWLFGVMITIGSPFDVLEHVGILFMSVALVIDDKYLNKNI